MAFDDDLKRRLRRLAGELEESSRACVPARAGAKRPVRLRPAAAGLGMAASIAATVVLFAQLLPGAGSSGVRIRPGAPGGVSSAPDAPDARPPADEAPEPTKGGTPIPDRAPGACGEPGPRKEPADGISVRASTSDKTVRRGGQIKLVATFRNERSTSAEYTEGNPRADFVVTDDAGEVVWVYSHGKAFTLEARVGSYAPGEEATVTQVWDLTGCSADDGSPGAPLPPGRYRVRAVWGGSLGGWSNLAEFEIT